MKKNKVLLWLFIALTFTWSAFGTVPSSTTWIQYALSTNPQTLTVPFVFQNGSDLLVLDSKASPPVVLAINSDYTVSGGSGSTGSVVTKVGGTNAVAAGDVITISRRVPLTQTTSFLNGGPLTASMIGQALDKLTTISQQLNLVGANSFQFQPDEMLSGVLAKSARSGNVLGFSQTGAIQYYPPANSTITGSSAQFASVAALRLASVSGVANGTAVQLSGYHAAGDGGGGTYVWDSTSTAADNGGTIIKVTGVATGRWILQHTGPVTAQQFGADATGATDSSATIQAMLNWAAATATTAAYVEVDFNGGTYQVNVPLVINGNYLVVNGQKASIRAAAAMDAIFQTGTGSAVTAGQQLTVENFSLAAASNANYALHIEQGSGMKVEGVFASNAVIAEYYVDGTTNKGLQTITFDTCFATGTAYGWYFNQNGNVASFTNFVLLNCDVEGASQAYRFITSSFQSIASIIGGVFENTTGSTIFLQGGGPSVAPTVNLDGVWLENGHGVANLQLAGNSVAFLHNIPAAAELGGSALVIAAGSYAVWGDTWYQDSTGTFLAFSNGGIPSVYLFPFGVTVQTGNLTVTSGSIVGTGLLNSGSVVGSGGTAAATTTSLNINANNGAGSGGAVILKSNGTAKSYFTNWATAIGGGTDQSATILSIADNVSLLPAAGKSVILYNGSAQVRATLTQGFQLGAPTGGDEGAGTLNVAAGVYLNGTAYTNPDYVLEKWATGSIVKFAGKVGAANYGGLKPLAEVETAARESLHLDGFGQDAKNDLFSGSEALLARVEEGYLYLFDHEHRLTALEARPGVVELRIFELVALIGLGLGIKNLRRKL